MTSDQFTNWLSGFISALGSNQPTNEQFNIVKDNLEKVFNKVTPNRKLEEYKKEEPKIASDQNWPKLDCDVVYNGGVFSSFSPVGDMLKKEFEDFNCGDGLQITGLFDGFKKLYINKELISKEKSDGKCEKCDNFGIKRYVGGPGASTCYGIFCNICDPTLIC